MFNSLKPQTLNTARDTMLATSSLSSKEANWLEHINGKVHKHERNYLKNNGLHYLEVGLSAMTCIEEALSRSQRPIPKRILDFLCGYGRVLRFLKVAYPKAKIHVTDLDSKAIQFCSKAFTVGTSKSSKDFNELNLSDTYDLIWCGSLLTHFNEAQILELLRFFYRHLNRGGICIFTTHGTRVEALLSSGEINYSLNPKQCQAILHQYKETGIGYSEYEPSRDGYGISLSSDAKIRHLAAKAGDWKCQLFHPAGWDHHQDVYSYFKHS